MPAPVEGVADGEDDEDWLAEVVVEPADAVDPSEVEAEVVPELVLDVSMVTAAVVDAELVVDGVVDGVVDAGTVLFPDADGVLVGEADPEDTPGITRVTPAALQVLIAKVLSSSICCQTIS